MAPPPALHLPLEHFYGDPLPFCPSEEAMNDASEMPVSARKPVGSDSEPSYREKRRKRCPSISSTNADMESALMKHPRGRPRGSTKKPTPRCTRKVQNGSETQDGRGRYWKASEKTQVFKFMLGADSNGESRSVQHKTNPMWRGWMAEAWKHRVRVSVRLHH